MDDTKPVKRARKPKAVKEETNNIDSITFENTEKDINYKEVFNNEVFEESKETKESKKTKEPKEPKEPKESKEPKAKKTPVPRKKKEATSTPIISPIITETLDTLETDLNGNGEQNIPAMVSLCISEPPHHSQPAITKYPYSANITNIYHLSDLHIQLYKRHNEYQVVFDKVVNYLKAEKEYMNIPLSNNTDIPVIALITGDILHSKSDLSPECVQLTYNFLKAISNVMPLVIIPGNHDINMNNRERLDALTPIISDLPKSNPIYYFLESGVYQISNLVFYHASIFDYQIIAPIKSDASASASASPKLSHIMLYHGRVNGAILFNGLEISEDNNKTVTPSTFSAYDITCLGDIHKHQFLTPNIAYAGSLIQQNLGEDVDKHGLIKWDIASRKGVHIPIKNDWSYITLYVDNKKANHQCSLKDGTHDSECTLAKNLRVRVLYRNTPESFISDYITLLKMNHTVHEYSYQNDSSFLEKQDSSFLEKSCTKNDEEDLYNLVNTNNKGARGAEALASLDITSGELQNKFLIEYINQNEPNITLEQIEEIKSLNIKQNQILKESNKNFNIQGFSGHYKLKRLEFSNLFSYGMRNVVDFTNFKGIIGIIAPNHLGKSAILDIIIFALFDKFTRKGSTKDIINIRSDFFDIRLEVSIGQWTYTIGKNGTRTKTNTVSSKIEFFRTHDIENTVERLEEDNASKTKERITELFGCYEDIINTSFSIQHDNSCFIDSENTDRRKELQRIMRFDIIDKLGDMANQSLTKYKDIREHISKKIDNDFIVNTKKAKQKAEILLELHTENKAYAKSKIKDLHEQILETSNKLNSDCTNFLKVNSFDESEMILEELVLKIQNNNDESNKIMELLGDGVCYFDCNSDSDFNNVMNLLKDTIINNENKNNEIIEDAIKKLKQIEYKNEKLYKSHKPCNIKIGDDSTPLDYLNNLKDANILKIKSYKSEINQIDDKIALLKEKEIQIEKNNEAILSLEKQMIKLPDSLLELVTDSTDNLYDEYKTSLKKMIDKNIVLDKNSVIDKTNINTILESKSYKKYESIAKKYFIASEISKYKIDNDINEEIILEQQNILEQDNINIKNEMKQIRTLELQIRQIESKIASLVNQNQQIDNDIDNLDNNKKINEELDANKTKKEKYEKRVSDIELNNKLLRDKTKLIYKYEHLQNNKIHLEKDLISIKDILSQFENYKTLIEDNSKIQKELDNLRAELADFEEVLEEVEKQYNIENTNLIKNIALIDQLRKDIAENKAIENNLTLYTIYRKALKQLPYLLLAKIQPVLEKKVNDLLSIITDFTLKFDMSDSKIDIYIDRSIYKNDDTGKYSGKLSSGSKVDRHILVNNASGFERFVSSLAIRLALLDISNLPKINFMAIDEGWSCFDTTNLNNVGQILDYLKTKFDYILTISHLTEIKQYCDTMISLRKDEKGFSKIII